MPDPVKMTIAMVVAAVIAAAIVGTAWVLTRRTTKATNPWLAGSWLVAVVAAHYVGVWWLGLLPNTQLAEASSRLFWIVLPAIVVVETLGATSRVPAAVVWTLRTLVALATTRVLLHGSTYVAAGDSSGPSIWLVTAIVGGAMLVVWLAMNYLTRLPAASPAPLVLAVVALASSLTIMLSGYATGGQLGLPLAAALVGSGVLMWWTGNAAAARPVVGYAVVALAGLLILGHYFAELKLAHALLLGASPLLALLPTVPVPAVPVLGRIPTWGRLAGALVLVLVPLGFVLQQAGQTFAERSAPVSQSSTPTTQPSLNDYMSFGK